MEKKFEEKFGLKTEEMEEILGGVVSSADSSVQPVCGMCQTCVMCNSSCVYCTSCVMCKSVAFVPGVATNDPFSSAGVYIGDVEKFG